VTVVEPVPPLVTESALPKVSEVRVALVAKRLVDDATVAKRLVVVALVKSELPVSVVEASEAETAAVSPPLNAMLVEVALLGNA